jgi:hypothetical protein
MEFDFLTGVSMTVAVFWVVAPCILVAVYRRFKVFAASNIREMSIHHLNVGKLLTDYTV